MKKLVNRYFYPTVFSVWILFLSVSTSFAQNGGIGAAAFVPNPSSMFEIQSGAAGNKGFLPPRVTDAQRAAMNPLPAAAQGLIVYQTNTAAGSLEGLYYNTSVTTVPNWVYLSGGGWALSGNAGTSPGVIVGQNFLGTTDPKDFIIATNSIEAVRVLANQFVKISTLGGIVDVGTGTAIVTADATGLLGKYIANMPPTGTLELWFRPVAASYIQPMSNLNIRVYDTAPAQPYGIYYDGGTNTVGGYFRTTSGIAGTTAVQGFSDVAGQQQYGYLGYNGPITVGASTIGGASVYGFTDDPNSTAVYGRTQNNASVAAVLGYSSIWIPGYFYGDDASALFNTRPGVYGQMNTSISKPGLHSAVRGVSLYTIAGNPGTVVGGNFLAGGPIVGPNITASTEDALGVYAIALGPFTGAPPLAGYAAGLNTTSGGYFQANGQWAYVSINGASARKIQGTGTVNEIISTPNHGRITLTAPESPEYWYIDYGSVNLVNGFAHVDLDPILKDVIVVDAQNPLKIFPQVNIPTSNGVVVMNKTASGFDIVEVNGGTSTGEVDYQIVAKPKTNFGEGRFSQAPGPAWLKHGKEPDAAKAANQLDYNKIFHWPADWDVYGYNPNQYMKDAVLPANSKDVQK
jgi:hypothetical protein